MTRLLSATGLVAAALAAPVAADAQSRCGATYELRPGDTLYGVTQTCRVSLATIHDLNPGLGDPDDLAVGTTIRLEPADGEPPAPDTGRDTYTVREGDTPYAIAQALGVSLAALLNENEELDPLALAVGEILDVPAGDRQAAIGVSPRTVAPGGTVTVTARGLLPSDHVTIGAGRSAANWDPLRTVQVGPAGRIEAQVDVPQEAAPGDVLTFVVDTDRGVTLKSADVEIVAGEDGDRRTLRGRVGEGVECPVLTTPRGETWSLVSDSVEFTPGAYVEVTGTVAEMSFCMQGAGTLQVRQIREVPAP